MPEKSSTKKIKKCLDKYYDMNPTIQEIGIDEAGRGPMFGRVYAAAVILPKDGDFDYSLMKDSKKFTSVKKITEVSNYIKQNAISYGIGYSCEKEIDDINILNATYKAMHRAIKKLINKDINVNDYLLLVDGNNFKSYIIIDEDSMNEIPYVCIKGGDNKYASIAAASILAKVARDEYIEELCLHNDKLDIRYGLLKNKGYGTVQHINGIETYGISEYHRKSFGICSKYS